MDIMDSMGQVDSSSLNLLDCVDIIDTVLPGRQLYTATIGCRSPVGDDIRSLPGVPNLLRGERKQFSRVKSSG